MRRRFVQLGRVTLDVPALKRVSNLPRRRYSECVRSDTEFAVELAFVVARGFFELGRLGITEPRCP